MRTGAERSGIIVYLIMFSTVILVRDSLICAVYQVCSRMTMTKNNILFITLLLAVGTFGQMPEEYKQLIVNRHNELRRLQHASNMNKLEWSDENAYEASLWLKHCNMEHQMGDFGENLFYKTGIFDTSDAILEALQSWYDEIGDYYYAGKQCYMSCHYTQMVWYNADKVGCAYEECSDFWAFGNYYSDAFYFGCWYSPKGNWMDKYPFNKTGVACGNCPGDHPSCDNGLCAK